MIQIRTLSFLLLVGLLFAQPVFAQAEKNIAPQDIPFSVPDDRQQLGQHLIIELFECDEQLIGQVPFVRDTLAKAAIASGATIVAEKFHQFSPQGVSGALILAESHIAIHTWPEFNYCAIDIFTCGLMDNYAAHAVVVEQFKSKRNLVMDLARGLNKDFEDVCSKGILFSESLVPLGTIKTTILADEKLLRHSSEHQLIELYQTKAFGKMLVLDGVIQMTEYDNAAYHEMAVHVPMRAAAAPRKVLVIGGGDGGVVAELVKYATLEEIVVCELDPDVVTICSQQFAKCATAFADPRVRIVYHDGAQFVKHFHNHFDLVIVDSTDFFGVAQSLFREEFYADMHHALTADGIAVTQSESMYYDRELIAGLAVQAARHFSIVDYYHTMVPTYPGGSIGFLYLSKKYGPFDLLDSKDVPLVGLEYYNNGMHRASFAKPTFFANVLNQ